MSETFKRPAYGEQALIVVPTADTTWAKTIAQASAIVAFRNDAENLVIYYEGNLYRASNLERFHERALVAYGRLTQRAPTVAMAMVPESEFLVIGHMHPGQVQISRSDLFDQWLRGIAPSSI